MIGLDANILLRAVLRDDTKQSPVAVDFLSKLTDQQPGLINGATLAEFVWTLESHAQYARQEIASALRAILMRPSDRFLDRGCVSKALTRFEAGKMVGFADALIGEINRAAGCSATYSFDDGASKKTHLFSLLKA